MPRQDDRLFVKNPFKHYRKTYNLTEVRIGLVILIGLAAILGWVVHKGQNPDPSLLALDVMVEGGKKAAAGPVDRGPLPKDLVLEGWKEGRVRSFDPDNLYEKINGRAGYYQSFGVEAMHFLTLEKEGAPTTLVDLELFDLGKPVNALGAYNGERDKDATPTVGERGLSHYSRNAMYLTRGKFYLRAIGSEESEAVLAQLKKVEARFDADLEGQPLPWSYALFLGRLELPPDAIAYFAENAFGFSDFASEVNVGRLEDETELFVKVAKDEADAAALAKKFDEGFAGYGEVKAGGFVEDRYIQTISKSGHIGRWVYGVRGAPDVAQAKAGLARLNKALDGLEVPQGAAPPAGEPDSEYTTPPSESDLGEPTYDSVETGEE